MYGILNLGQLILRIRGKNRRASTTEVDVALSDITRDPESPNDKIN
jgi:hypothetical protein